MNSFLDGVWVAVAALVSGGFGFAIRRADKPAPPSKESQSMDTASRSLAAAGGVIDDLQKDRSELRRRLDDLEAKVDRVIRKARHEGERCDRNLKLLHDHIERCCDMMRSAGLVPPPQPVLENDPD